MQYFDHNATAPLMPEAQRAWLEASSLLIGNASSPHRLGNRAESALNRARETLAGILHCHPFDLTWTSGATEANNTILHHLSVALPAKATVLLAAIEHPSLIQPAVHYFPNRHHFVPVTPNGTVDLARLAQDCSQHRPALIAVMAVNNETGILQPWQDILSFCRQHKILFFCDATQWVGKLPGAELGTCDFLTGSAHKFGGPKGVGFLKSPPGTALHPLLHGGPQEEGRRAGTENVAGILSMVAALKTRETQMKAGQHTLRQGWRHRFETELIQELPGARLLGKRTHRLWNTVSVVMPPTPSPLRWTVKLDKAGFAVSSGSACASGKEKPSHVLAAMGLSPEEASRVLRLSSGWETPENAWFDLLQALRHIHRQGSSL